MDEDKNTGQLAAARLFRVVVRGTLQGKMSTNICCEYFIKKRCEIHSCIIKLKNACLICEISIIINIAIDDRIELGI